MQGRSREVVGKVIRCGREKRMPAAIVVAGQPNGLVPALGCLCAKQRKGRSPSLCTPYSLVGRRPTQSGGLAKSELFYFTGGRA
eukprot:scaffold649_cov347-Pavlova_lutheri.AAC.29